MKMLDNYIFFENVWKCLKIFENLENLQKIRNVCKCLEMCENMWKSLKIFDNLQNVSKCLEMFENFQNVSKLLKMFENMWECLKMCEMFAKVSQRAKCLKTKRTQTLSIKSDITLSTSRFHIFWNNTWNYSKPTVHRNIIIIYYYQY